MGHRQNRDTPTRPRRIHATDDEWSEIKLRADDAGLSIAAYVVSQSLRSGGPTRSREDFLRAQVLTSTYALLAEIADMTVRAGNDVDTAVMLRQLDAIARKLVDVDPCGRVSPSSEGGS